MGWARRLALLATGLLSGIVAALCMILLMSAAREWLGISPPPESVPDRIAPMLSISTFFSMMGQYGGYNGLKQFGVRSGIQILLATGAVFGIAYAIVAESAKGRVQNRLPFQISRLGALFLIVSGTVFWAVSMVFLWPVLGGNYRGLPPSQARWVSSLALLLQYLGFAAALAVTYHAITRPGRVSHETDPVTGVENQTVSLSRPVARRAVVATLVGALLALPSYGLIRRMYDRATFAYDGTPYSGPGVQPITPTDQFYSVTKNVVDPNVRTSVWAVEIWGTVDNPTRFDFERLSEMTPVDQETTLMCISNTIGAGLFSNAIWTGVPLAELLTGAGVQQHAVEVKLHGADAYTDTFSIEKALDPTTMVVYRMNGEPLPERHGYPARVIVPGLYGEKSVKWVTGIEVLDREGKGFYEQQGWGPNFVIPTRSDMFSPLWRRGSQGDAFVDPFPRNVPVTIRGRAFGGNRGIRSVEASVDGGETWAPATVDYPGSQLTWTFWSFTWTPAESGEIIVLSRAVDGDGDEQPSETRSIVPEGATGYHRVSAQIV